MNILTLLYGQARFVNNKEANDSYNRLIGKHNVRTVGHLWWSEEDENYTTSSWSNMESCKSDKNVKNYVNQIYQNNNILYEKPRFFKPDENIKQRFNHMSHIFNEKNLSNVMSHLYSFEKSMSLLTEDLIEWTDLIIMWRTDLRILDIIDLNSLSTDKFYISNHHDRFPDLIFIFGKKYLNFLKTYSNIDKTSNLVWEPSPEAFKWETFKLFYSESELNKIKLGCKVVRE